MNHNAMAALYLSWGYTPTLAAARASIIHTASGSPFWFHTVQRLLAYDVEQGRFLNRKERRRHKNRKAAE